MNALLEEFSLQLDALMGFLGDDLLVVGIVTLHHLGEEVDILDQPAGVLFRGDLE